jgi:ADP-heptose:LPS heptosyltransferase
MCEDLRNYRSNLGAVHKLLVIRPGALGDGLLMLPALHALRARFPAARIDIMGYPQRWEWVLGRGLVDAVHTIERSGMHLLFCEGKEVPEALRSFLGDYDLILSYRPDPDKIFARNLRALGPRVILSQPPFPPPPPPKLHVADFALRLVYGLGGPLLRVVPRLQLHADELALAEPFFATHQLDPVQQPLIVLHPGSGSRAKCWPIEEIAALIDSLARALEARVLIVTGYAEEDLLARLLPLVQMAKPLLAENWPLLPTAALLARATVFVGFDSGLTHLAATLGRPTVAIFGPTDPEIWGPRGEHVTVVQLPAGPTVADAPSRGWWTFQKAEDGIRRVVEAVRDRLMPE